MKRDIREAIDNYLVFTVRKMKIRAFLLIVNNRIYIAISARQNLQFLVIGNYSLLKSNLLNHLHSRCSKTDKIDKNMISIHALILTRWRIWLRYLIKSCRALLWMLSNNNRRNDGNRDTKSLCATALTSGEKGNCAIKQETLKHHSPFKLADLACDEEFRARGDCKAVRSHENGGKPKFLVNFRARFELVS